MIEGKEARRLRTTGATWQSAPANRELLGAEAEGATGVNVFASSTWREKGSTKRRGLRKENPLPRWYWVSGQWPRWMNTRMCGDQIGVFLKPFPTRGWCSHRHRWEGRLKKALMSGEAGWALRDGVVGGGDGGDACVTRPSVPESVGHRRRRPVVFGSQVIPHGHSCHPNLGVWSTRRPAANMSWRRGRWSGPL